MLLPGQALRLRRDPCGRDEPGGTHALVGADTHKLAHYRRTRCAIWSVALTLDDAGRPATPDPDIHSTVAAGPHYLGRIATCPEGLRYVRFKLGWAERV
jgi:hypothetical protein